MTAHVLGHKDGCGCSICSQVEQEHLAVERDLTNRIVAFVRSEAKRVGILRSYSAVCVARAMAELADQLENDEWKNKL